jgi:hypothetical protein
MDKLSLLLVSLVSTLCSSLLLLDLHVSIAAHPEAVTFRSGEVVLDGDLSKPEGTGPSRLYFGTMGSPGPGDFEYGPSGQLGKIFTSKGYVFFFLTGSLSDDRPATN